MATRIEQAEHTSIRRRIEPPDGGPSPLPDLCEVGLTLMAYRALLEWTASIECGGVSPPKPQAAQALRCLRHEPEAWLGRVKAHRFKYRAYGALTLLRRYAESLNAVFLLAKVVDLVGAERKFCAADLCVRHSRHEQHRGHHKRHRDRGLI